MQRISEIAQSGETVRRLLIIDDEENMRHMLYEMLKDIGFQIDVAKDGKEALMLVEKDHYAFILCDVKMPVFNGLDFLKKSAAHTLNSTIIMMSAYGNIDTAVEAMKLGAYDFISKPFKGDEIRLVIEKAEERDRLKTENQLLRDKIKKIEGTYTFDCMIGKSRKMQSIFKLATKLSQFNTTVLITGESGTGKELVAKGIHEMGNRCKGPWVPINCGSIPESLLESELFGHLKGAYTGAVQNKRGLFEEADGGTLFLDEIGEMPVSLQVKLLRVLQDSQVRPLGGSQPREVDVRVIAATSKNLASETKTGNFREDLYYRLKVMPIHLPPLRERTEDIPLLCSHFLDRLNHSLGVEIDTIAPSAMKFLLEFSWPGNVRELENVLERAMILSEGRILEAESFPGEIRTGRCPMQMDSLFDGYSLKTAQKTLEKQFITRALKKTSGNRTKAARLLEISHPSLLTKIKAYEIDM